MKEKRPPDARQVMILIFDFFLLSLPCACFNKIIQLNREIINNNSCSKKISEYYHLGCGFFPRRSLSYRNGDYHWWLQPHHYVDHLNVKSIRIEYHELICDRCACYTPESIQESFALLQYGICFSNLRRPASSPLQHSSVATEDQMKKIILEFRVSTFAVIKRPQLCAPVPK